jgi:hypothetical protein
MENVHFCFCLKRETTLYQAQLTLVKVKNEDFLQFKQIFFTSEYFDVGRVAKLVARLLATAALWAIGK